MQTNHLRANISRLNRILKPRFGLRLIFVLIGLVAVILGVVLPWHNRAAQQRNAIKTIEMYGGRVAYSFQYNQKSYPYLISTPGEDPNIFCRWLGSEYFREPVYVVLSYQPDEFLAIKRPPVRWIGRDSESFAALNTIGSGVRHLDIRFTNLKELKFLRKLPNIEILDMRGQGIVDIGPLAYVPSLKRLYLSLNPINDYSAIGGLSSLEVLEMRWHNLQNLDVLNECENLKDVCVPGKRLKDISALASKKKLTTLDVSHSKVSDISALDGLNLRKVNIEFTEVSCIDPLKSSNALEALDANSTKISNLTPLATKTKLLRLFVANTEVSDLTPLKNSKEIQHIGFTGTNVSDGSVLLKMPNLKRCFVTPIVASTIGDKIPLSNN